MAAAVLLDHQTRRFILIAQLGELLTRQLRIDAVVVFGIVVFVVFIFFVVVLLFARQFRTDVGGGWGDVLFRVRIDEAGDQIGQARFARFDAIVLLKQVGNGFRVFGNRALHLVDAVFDAFGDVDFAFARQQFDGTHFAHVHAHRVGGAADFGFHAGQNLCGGFFRIFVRAVRVFGEQQVIGVRCFFHHLDAHVVNHLDDVFDLIGVDDIFRQMVIDLSIGQIALLLTTGDK